MYFEETLTLVLFGGQNSASDRACLVFKILSICLFFGRGFGVEAGVSMGGLCHTNGGKGFVKEEGITVFPRDLPTPDSPDLRWELEVGF